MTRYLFLLLFSVPLLACATERVSPESITLEKWVNTIITGKSNNGDRQYWRALLKWSDECESAFQGPAELHDADKVDTDSGLKVYPGQNKQYILRVTCTLGSYQGYQHLYQVSFDNNKITSKNLMFPVFKVENNNKVSTELSSEIWGNFLRASNHKQMTVLNRYSGYGHCGTLTTYSIINGEVTATKLLSQPDCESKNASRDPEKWPGYSIP